MVASELPSATPQTPALPGAAPAAAAPVNGDATASDTTAAFSSLLTQMLGGGAATADAAAAAQKTVLKEVVQKVDSDADANAPAVVQLAAAAPPLGAAQTPVPKGVAKKVDKESDTTAAADAAAQLAGAALPLIAGVAQVVVNTPVTNASNQAASRSAVNVAAAAAATTMSATTISATTMAATTVAANAQSQAATTANDMLAANTSLKTTIADAQAQLPQIVSANAASGSALGSDSTSTSDSKTGKQDSNGANLNAASIANNTTQLQNTASRTELQVEARVGTPAWRDEVGAKLTWMTSHGIQQGTLHLSPENLGPLEVHITTQNSQVSVWFGAAHADTRAALENALPRLREMFATQGMSLSDAGVFREPPKDTPRSYTTNRSDIQGISSIEAPAVTTVGRRDGILDAYA